MRNWLRRHLAQSELFSFNIVRRDRWIVAQAAQLPVGTKVLDVGAGSCPYREQFAHCQYRTQDLVPLRADQLSLPLPPRAAGRSGSTQEQQGARI